MKNLLLKSTFFILFTATLKAQDGPEPYINYMTDPSHYKEKGKGEVVSQTNVLQEGVEEIVVGNGMQLYLTNENEQKFTIEAQENILPLVSALVDGNTLTFKLSASLETTKGIKIRIPVGSIHKIRIKEGGYFNAGFALKMDALDLIFESGSSGKCDLRLNAFSCMVRGGSHLTLTGNAVNAHISVKEGSELNGKEMDSQNCKVVVLGASDCTLKVTESLNAVVENESTLYYYGKPKQVSESTNLNGKIHKKSS